MDSNKWGRRDFADALQIFLSAVAKFLPIPFVQPHYIVDLELKNFYGCITKDMIKRYVDEKYNANDVIKNFDFEIINKL